MKSMIIGIDLDQTLIHHIIQAEDLAAKNLGITDYPECNDWYFSNFSKEHKTEMMRLFNDLFFMGINYNNPIVGSQEKLFKWSMLGHKIIIITARNKPVIEATKHLVEDFFPVVNGLFFVDINTSKKGIMLKEKIDVWIDDSPTGIKTSCELGIETYVIYNDITKRYIPKEMIQTLPVKCVENISDIKLKGEI